MRVIAHSYINPKGLHVNGELLAQVTEEAQYLKQLYSSLSLDYPKFYKMDNLSKLAVLAVEGMLKVVAFPSEGSDLQLVFANHSSSQQSDLKFIDSYTNLGNPSPSLFVYTLPNIVTGELSIRHKWYGENSFFIQPEFNPDLFIEQSSLAFLRGNNLCLCAWVEAQAQGNEECFLFLVSRSEGSLESADIMDIYKSYTV
jgi:hypothetical protein